MQNSLSWLERGTVSPEVVGSIPAKTPKTENSNLHVFETLKKRYEITVSNNKSNDQSIFYGLDLSSPFLTKKIRSQCDRETKLFEAVSRREDTVKNNVCIDFQSYRHWPACGLWAFAVLP